MHHIGPLNLRDETPQGPVLSCAVQVPGLQLVRRLGNQMVSFDIGVDIIVYSIVIDSYCCCLLEL